VFALAFNPHFPQLVIVGESSVGTWMSGVLLVISASASLIIGMRRGDNFWFYMTVFFLVLALDERFMFHEHLKERLIFMGVHWRFIYELPVMIGAGIGAFVAYRLNARLKGASRLLLYSAVGLGTTSIVIDILSAGVLWEECAKLLAELVMACAVLKKVTE